MPSLKIWKQQLFTHEDPAHFHKILGITVLASYAWRFTMMGESDMGFATYPQLTLPTILLHWSLSMSSMLFNIPKKRIVTGDRICKSSRRIGLAEATLFN